MLNATKISHSFGRTVTLDGVDLHIPDQGVVGLVGPNGSGKTTLLSTLYSALSPNGGEVTVDGQQVERMRAKSRAKKLAVVVQDASAEVDLTVAELVSLARLPHKTFGAGITTQDAAVVDEALEACGVLDLADRQVSQLSGGQRQRVMIARGLAQQSTHLLLDEPTNHLDLHYQHEVLKILRRINRGSVVVLHDLNLANTYCDQIVVLDHGKVVAAGPPSEVMTPQVLEPIYGVMVQRVEVSGRWHLILGEGADN